MKLQTWEYLGENLGISMNMEKYRVSALQSHFDTSEIHKSRVGCSKQHTKAVKITFLTVFPTLNGCNFGSI